MARGKNSGAVPVSSDLAVCFCGYGANKKATLELEAGSRICNEADEALWRAAGMGVATLNDTSTHAEVLAMFDKAIKETA